MTGPDPRVSVVIATNRGGPWLDEAVASVLAQTMDDLELIIVDDGVPGGVRQLAALDDRIRLVAGRQAGISMARNIGNAAARGELVAVLDDDDRWMPDKLERQLALLDRHPESAMCHTQFERIDADGVVIGPGWATPTGQDALTTGTLGVAHSTTIWRRDVVMAVGGYDPTRRLAEDLDLLLKVLRWWSICFDPGVLAQYRVHDENASTRYRDQWDDAHRTLLDHLEIAAAGRRSRTRLPPRSPLVVKRVRHAYVPVAAEQLRLHLRDHRWRSALDDVVWMYGTAPLDATRLLIGKTITATGRTRRANPVSGTDEVRATEADARP
ncbi:MAG: glycosyltransferase family 2 protein [Acidimicrobiales bacterium]